MVVVPNYSKVTIGANATITTSNIFTLFRCSGDVTINGQLIKNWGALRSRLSQFTHNDLPERLPEDNYVIILSDGTVTTSSTARIGNEFDGSGKGGAAVSSTKGAQSYGNPGGCGYGGSGYACQTNTSSTTKLTSQAGMVGYGGRAENGTTQDNTTLLSIQGVHAGYMKSTDNSKYTLAGQMPGGGSGNGRACNNVMIIAKTLKIAQGSLSTGGRGGGNNGSTINGGWGTGFCYLAYQEAI